MADKKETKQITIKKGSMVLTVDRSELIEICETHDGVVFNLKNGLQLQYTDQFMPQHTKEILRNTSNHFAEQKIVFDLDNEKQPAFIDAL